MMKLKQPEVWMRGPVEGVPALLQPAAHALLQAREEVEFYLKDFPDELLWNKPAGLASIGFHLQHLTGVLDRLFTYAAGDQLSDDQLLYLQSEGVENDAFTTDQLKKRFADQISKAIETIGATPESVLTDFRGVGRKQLPSTVIGLIFHAAEHTQRHVGQLLVTSRILLHQQGI
jgi:uncharacterized damage-inducible protein DinB